MTRWIVVLLLTSALHAQAGLFDQLRKTDFPYVEPPLHQVVADFDGDGDVDVFLIARFPIVNPIALNDGRGRFSLTGSLVPVDAYASFAAGDVDGDGDLDLVAATRYSGTRYPGQTRLFLNDGRGRFVDATSRMPRDRLDAGRCVLVDVDQDRDLDLVIGDNVTLNTTGQTRLYLNLGRGVFKDATRQLPTNSDLTVWVDAGDLDGDGDQDLLIANGSWGAGQANRIWLNNGRGSFVDATKVWMDGATQRTKTASFVDVDGDRDLDVLEINDFDWRTGRGSRVLYQNRGTFTPSALGVPRIERPGGRVAFGDIDRDGDVDAMITGSPGKLLINESGSFADAGDRLLPARSDIFAGVAFADADGDGDLDIMLGNSNRRGADLLLQVERGFISSRAGVVGDHSVRPVSLAAADLDGDRLVDYVVVQGANGDRRSRLFRQTSTGFVDATLSAFPYTARQARDVTIFDADGDGDLDVVLANAYQRSTLLRNDGRGRFTDLTRLMPPNKRSVDSIDAGDIDGDGDVDLVVACDGEQNLVWVNNGFGRFGDETAKRWTTTRERSKGLLLVDVDGDKDLDIVVANGEPQQPARCRLFLNNGRGVFRDSSTQLPQTRRVYRSIVAADLDKDGDLDLLASHDANNTQLWVNIGNGLFSETGWPVAGQGPLVADFDEDGDLDVATSGGHWRNDGRLRFTRVSNWSLHGVAVDYDLDGDIDVIGGQGIITNRFRHVFGLTHPRLGRNYRVAIDAEPAMPGPNHLAFLFISGSALSRPLHLGARGSLWLDPARSIMLGPWSFWTRKQVDLRIPTAASLAGKALVTQALILHRSSITRWRLSNHWADVIVR